MVQPFQGPQGAVLVLGMHRSGTSALTRGLEVLGIDLGRNLKDAVAGDNEKGFFEDATLSGINDDLLALTGARWDSLLARDASEADVAQVNALKLRAIDAIVRQFGGSQYFAFKDPRSCRAIPFWKDVFSRLDLRVTYVIVFRNPMDVALSLQQRDGFPRSRSYYLWLLHMLSAVRHTDGQRRVFVNYDDLLVDPEAALTRIGEVIDCGVDADALGKYRSTFLDLNLRRHSGPAARLELDAACPPDVRSVFSLLCAEAEGKSPSQQDWQRLFEAYDRLVPYTLLLDEVDRQMLSLFEQKNKLAADLGSVSERLAQAEVRGSAQDEAIGALRAEAAGREVRVATLRSQLDDMAAAREAERANDLSELSVLHGRLRVQAELEMRLAEAESARRALGDRVVDLQKSIEELHEQQARDERLLSLHSLLAAQFESSQEQWLQERGDWREQLRMLEEQRQAQQRLLQAQEEQLRTLLDQSRQHRIASEERQHFERAVADSARRAAESAQRSAALEAAYRMLADRLRSVYASSSWRLAGPLRALKASVSGGHVNEVVPPLEDIVAAAPAVPLESSLLKRSVTSTSTPSFAYFTICSRNFLAFAKTLFQTLREHHPDAQFYVALCDAPDAPFNPADEPFPFIYLDDIDLPQWREMSQRYNITEFNTAIKPFVFRHLMKRGVADAIVYLDPDIIVKGHMSELEEAFAAGAYGVLTPHVTMPAENVETSDVKMLQYGIYNLGFAAFRVCADAISAMEWWGRRLINDCVIKLEEGLFVDQKWADLLPAILPNLHVLRHPGYNVAYWNVAQRRVVLSNGIYTVNGEPLRFAHFSGSKLEDATVYSRHSGQFNTTNIGDLVHLLNEYRSRVFGNEHARYQKIPYAFSWNGQAGVNLHTPEPTHQKHVHAESGPAPQPPSGGPELDVSSSAARALRMVRTASNLAGGFPQLALKATRVLANGGFGAVRQRIRLVEGAANELELRQSLQSGASTHALEVTALGEAGLPSWRRRLLFIDWSTPRPDRDAGSITAFRLMEILVYLGYDVTFVPSDLEYLGAYTDAVRALGVRCLHREDIGSVKAHLETHGAAYDFMFLCRAPIAGLYIDDIRLHAPEAQIILNTSDLHYLRDLREAELSGDRGQIEAAERAKDWELGIIRACDITIVMSEVEKNILRHEAPDADVRLLPLMFVDVDEESASFTQRQDIIFIGGFPHLPNVDAVLYFAREIFPLVRARLPGVTWHIVGNAPPADVLALDRQPGIRVHGYVQDITPLFRSARLSVAPLRYGAGIKGKLGTSLAFGVPAVATSIASEGMHIAHGEQVLVADDPARFAQAVIDLYSDEATWTRMSQSGRDTMLREYSVPAGRDRIGALMQSATPGFLDIEAYEVRSHAVYGDLQRFLGLRLQERRALEASLVRRDAESFTIDGFCAVCGESRQFNVSFLYSGSSDADGRPLPNWREHLDCSACGLQNRLRAGVHLFEGLLRPSANADVYLTEQGTALYDLLKSRYPRLVGSEFFGTHCALGEEMSGLRNEDLTRLTFADGSFDFVLSFDVMEHVADDVAAMRGIHRCLKPGGRLLFAAPFSRDRERKVVRAVLRKDGEIEHILAPEYHGSVADPEKGSLCFRYFAWDVLDDLKSAGFENCRVVHYWSRDFAYLGGEQFLFIADKPRRPARTH